MLICICEMQISITGPCLVNTSHQYDVDVHKDDRPVILESFSRTMHDRRSAQGLTQRDLADRVSARGVKVDQSAITRIEKGQREPKLTEAVAISGVLGFKIDHLPTDAITQYYAVRDDITQHLGMARAHLKIAMDLAPALIEAGDGPAGETIFQLEKVDSPLDLVTIALARRYADQHGYADEGTPLEEYFVISQGTAMQQVQLQLLNFVSESLFISPDEVHETGEARSNG